jgi:hypothetical protein
MTIQPAAEAHAPFEAVIICRCLLASESQSPDMSDGRRGVSSGYARRLVLMKMRYRLLLTASASTHPVSGLPATVSHTLEHREEEPGIMEPTSTWSSTLSAG